MSTKIVAGLFKGLSLTAPKGLSTRPTTSMVREAVMDILGSQAQDARVLDLFAGSGAMGLEALSRGAGSVVLCDRSKPALAAIHQNVARLPDWAQEKVAVLKLVAPERIQALAAYAPFDLVFLDPPYGDLKAPQAALAKLASLVSPGAVAVWEQDGRSPNLWQPSSLKPWTLSTLRRYGAKAAAFLEFPLAPAKGGDSSEENELSERAENPEDAEPSKAANRQE